MRQPRAAEAFRLLRGDHEALVRTARRRTQVLLHRGDPTAALVVVDEALTNLPDDGTLPPEVHADLRLQLLADRSAALGALAEEIYHGPRPAARRRLGPRPKALAVLLACALSAVTLAVAARWAATHLAGAWSALAPMAIAFGAVATLVATTSLLAPPPDRDA